MMKIRKQKKSASLDAIYSVYLFLLIFTTFNKGFVPFDFDLRIVVTVFSLFFAFLIISRPLRGKKLFSNPISKWVLLLYSVIFLTTCVTNDLSVLSRSEDFRNLVVLNAYNFINVFVILEYKYNKLNKFIYKAIKISAIFLILSQVAVLMGVELPFANYHTETTASVDDGVFGIASALGVSTRIDGYGIDPNYVSLVMMLFICLALTYEKKITKRILYIALASFSILISFSRTILLASIPVLLAMLIFFAIKRKTSSIKKASYLLTAIVSALFVMISIVKPFNESSSMNIRYSLWDRSVALSQEKKFMGAGLGAFREYSLEYSGFYVQNHSTMFQMIAEHGIIAYIIFCIIIAKILILCKDNKFLFIATLTFFVWSFTYETMYIPHLILYLGIVPKILLTSGEVKK